MLQSNLLPSDPITTKAGIQIGMRPWEETDEPFVYSSWCRQVRHQPPFDSFSPENFRRHKERIIEDLACRHGVWVAHHLEHREQVLGYICGKAHSLFFIYVKSNMRNLGIGSSLMERTFLGFKEVPITFAYKTAAVRHLRKKWQLSYDPYSVAL